MARYVTWGILCLVGVAAFTQALGFGFGSGPQIGSAVIPLALSGGIALLSMAGLVRAGREETDGTLDLRALSAVGAGVVAFILAIDRIGLIPATLLCMGLAYAGQGEARYLGFIAHAVLFAAGVWAIFVAGLGLPVPAFGG